METWRYPNKNQQAPTTRLIWRVSPKQHTILLARKSQISCQQQNKFSKFGFVGLFILWYSTSVLPSGCRAWLQSVTHLGFSSMYWTTKSGLKHKQLQATAAEVHFWQCLKRCMEHMWISFWYCWSVTEVCAIWYVFLMSVLGFGCLAHHNSTSSLAGT